MRALFLLLVLANLAFFAWTRYLSPGDPATDAQPFMRQVEPERLRVISAGEIFARAQTGAALIACIEWGAIPGTASARAWRALESLALGARLSERKAEEAASWWVYMPPQGSRQGAQRKAAELKALGEDDYEIVEDDERNRWSISLGLYGSEEQARARLGALREKGVRSAVLRPREPQSENTWLEVRGVDAALHARLRAIAREFAGTELRECSARS